MILTAVALLTVGSMQKADAYPGELDIIKSDGTIAGICPLKNTTVNAQVSGFGARVHVVQSFENKSETPIEAVYTFPLPDDAAVDQMRIAIGTRVVEGEIKKREEAKKIYEQAKSQGQTAALLDQERPNIFTQRVANIMPHEAIKVDISYVQILKYEDGEFEFSFPMVVGPRYLGHTPDPGSITPPIQPPERRTGSNIELTVNIDPGTSLSDLHSQLHKIDVSQPAANLYSVKLARADEIPNKDFILRYRTTGDTVKSAFLSHMDKEKGGGYFTLILTPPKVPAASQIAPREILFVVDQSGSQSGLPIEKSKELTLKMMKTMRPGDTCNVIGFSNDARKLWPNARPYNRETAEQANEFVSGLQADGGTELMKAVVAAFQQPEDPRRLRIVLFNTDGYVGNEADIIDTVQRMRGSARMFTFGIGNSVNRYLIDGMSEVGQGDAEVVTLNSDADKAVERLRDRLESPVLTNVGAKFEGVEITSVLPSAIPDVFSGKPIVIYGRYAKPGPGKVVLSGKLGGKPWSQTVDVSFSDSSNASAIETLWARKQVDNLTRQNMLMTQKGTSSTELAKQITQVGLDYKIVTAFTSFVAVDKKVVNQNGKQVTVAVPVPMADGVTMEKDVAYSIASPAMGKRMGGAGGIGGGNFAAGGLGGTLPRGGLIPQGLEFLSFDPSDNSIIVRDKGKVSKYKEADLRKHKPASGEKLENSLKTATGKVKVIVLVKTSSAAVAAKLVKAGLTVGIQDDSSKIIVGTIDAADLKKLVALDVVEWIEPAK